MINVSNEFKQYMANDKRQFLAYITIELQDGTRLDLDNSDIWENSIKLEDGVTANGKFTIGSCIVGKLVFTLNNIYDKFSAYDFDGVVVTLMLGLELSDSKIEKIRKGIFTVDEPSYDGTTITLECLDNMSKFDKDYSEVKTVYPATLGEIVRDICNHCEVYFDTPGFDNRNYEVAGRPVDDSLTCRQVLAYCAQLACCFGRCNTQGRLEFKWFNQSVFEKNDNLDGGFFDEGGPQYISGDVADGGNFDDYSSGVAADGGTFDDLGLFHHIYSLSSFNVNTDDVVITGIQVTEEFTETENDKKQTVTVGSSGYALVVSGNKLIQKGTAERVAQYLGGKLIGLKFRPMSTQTLGDPTIEAGDMAYVTDRRQNTYSCLITNLTFNMGGFMNVSCDAETPGKNSAKQYSEFTQAIVEIRKEAQKQASSLATVMSQAFGVFKTEEAQEDGSIIYYMHDKPTLAESMCIWKFTADAFAVSTDGGRTWNAGLDASGNATVNILSAIGINCDWIHAGTLTLGGYNNQNGKMVMQDADGNEIGRWDKDGVYAIGAYVCDGKNNTNRVKIENGSIQIMNKLGNVLCTLSAYTIFGKEVARIVSGQSSIYVADNYISMYGKDIQIDSTGGAVAISGSVLANGRETKTGTAQFSDGSELRFVNGSLVGGYTTEGGSF